MDDVLQILLLKMLAITLYHWVVNDPPPHLEHVNSIELSVNLSDCSIDDHSTSGELSKHADGMSNRQTTL